MVRRPRKSHTADDYRAHADRTQYITELLKRTGFHVELSGSGFDLVVAREDIFGPGRAGIEVMTAAVPIPVTSIRDKVDLATRLGLTSGVILAKAFSPQATNYARTQPLIRLYTFDDFERELMEWPRRFPSAKSPGRKRSARTAVGRAVVANEQQISVTAAALHVLISERIASLQAERPNSDEAQARRDEMIEDYEKLKRNVDALAAAAAAFKKGEKTEVEAVKTTKTFAEGVQNWWAKGHMKIIDKSMDMGLFGCAVGICSMAGAGGKMSAIVSAALVGGKPLAGALKDAAKKAFGND